MSPIAEAILADFAASYWLKNALRSALERDPVDALADAEMLAAALYERRNEIFGQLASDEKP
ncbi:hypothetical protein [Crenothrix polyspora]|jgi:hypothetical protein|uniref:Uncharacterized protein n=1 Tax=Crenothrix polyspora TaxID=360316 RepID=A0A1R4HEL1_9GAMM|nr:hypothetical protein [Crenothrix polyspora]SJM94647.1 hypothetical protein CRENPOLYSF1_570008 [Crenothrix polyspora]